MSEFVQAKAVAITQWAEDPNTAREFESHDWHAARAGGEGRVSAACGVVVRRRPDSPEWVGREAEDVCATCVAQVKAGGGYA